MYSTFSKNQNYWDFFWMDVAASEALEFLGATTPNPAVGACLVFENELLAVAAHQKAGEKHAEVLAIQLASAKYPASILAQSTLYTTLEPCNHTGRQPPCSEAILKLKPKRVVYAFSDPNPHVTGGGAKKIADSGINIAKLSGDENNSTIQKCQELLKGFAHWSQTGKPYLVHKMAFRFENKKPTMIPSSHSGNTFSRPESIKLAHLQRKWADGILTDLATVLKDNPQFTVRALPDHKEKKRILAVLSKTRTLPHDWFVRQKTLGFEVFLFSSIDQAIEKLGTLGTQRVLVECGPTVSKILIHENKCQETLTILNNVKEDQILKNLNISESI